MNFIRKIFQPLDPTTRFETQAVEPHLPQVRKASRRLRARHAVYLNRRQAYRLIKTSISRQFVHSPLQLEDSIRNVEIEPRNTSYDYVHVRILHAQLHDIPHVHAVSYVWGKLKAQRRDEALIICNGRFLTVSANLANALKSLEQQYRSVPVWIDKSPVFMNLSIWLWKLLCTRMMCISAFESLFMDRLNAICVDQRHKQQRIYQVKFMADIYRNAQNVLVYLADGEHPLGLHHAEYLSERLQKTFRVIRNIVEDPREMDGILANWSSGGRMKVALLKALSDARWFHRIWTTQEIGLAKLATFRYRGQEIERLTLHTAYALCKRRIPSTLLHSIRFRPEKIVFLYDWVSTNANLSFLEVLEQTESRETTDPRDRIYALMSHPSAEGVVDVDYSQTVSTVYTDLAVNMMERDENLKILSYIINPRNAVDLGIPSWFPAWRLPRRSNQLTFARSSLDARGDIFKERPPDTPASADIQTTLAFVV
ncbi:hypothetical protein BT63DRAFT_453849 [Microthyrium microscopicum]|uniref:Heterokaryon incompatibility domain-containing protein n=1 Tax=Microthyrium microscopicum TaxID=703497 RepID=A0A6A6UJ00_9PEZI|nr:hypothetical protein BT63DRAFT_453849 [Microthyrium microscopicum]